MNFKIFLWLNAIFLASVLSSCFMASPLKERCPNIKTPLASVRKRRHLAFPEGSSVSVTTSIVKTFMTHVPSGWYLVIEAELVYKLPNADIIGAAMRRKLHHRQKRQFWEVLRNGLNHHNLNGHACVLRTVCEAERKLAPPGRSLVHDILRALFTAPLHEVDFIEEMDSEFKEFGDRNVCEKPIDCPFSCVNFILDLNKQE